MADHWLEVFSKILTARVHDAYEAGAPPEGIVLVLITHARALYMAHGGSAEGFLSLALLTAQAAVDAAGAAKPLIVPAGKVN